MKRIKLLLRITAVLFCLAYPFIMAQVAYAIADPDSTPTIDSFYCNRNLITTGDVLVYGMYTIPYAAVPTEPADETFIFRLIDADGVTELGMIRPFVKFDNGYNEGVYSFYFPTGITWSDTHIIRISQNPVHFPSPTSVDYVIPPSAWTASTTQADNQTEVAINCISFAEELESYYPAYTFLESSAGGTVLSDPTGETYFRGAIYGIQLMAPSLFLVQIADADVTARTWTTAQFETYRTRFDANFIGWSTNATANQFGLTPGAVMALIFALPICIGAVIVTSIKWQKSEPGLIFCALVMLCCAAMGWLPMGIFASLFQAMGIYVSYLWFYSRG